MIGTTLAHYRIVEKIGAGGMGEVYRAHDEKLDRDVAIKVLHQKVAQDSDRLARFEREAKAVAKLDHPNILAIHHFGTDQGVTYAVTELLEGQNLRQAIPASGITWQKVAEIGSSIADGLAAAHGRGVVHRDLKPENVFITSEGRVKVLDFGLAQVKEPVEEDAETATLTPAGTAVGTVMGTMGYMSPEQLKGEPADARSDVFALGSVLYEMLSGQAAFLRKSTAETTAAILKEELPPLSDSLTTLPAELGRTVRRCLEKSPEARFQSASDLAYNLRSISTDRAIPVEALTETRVAGRKRTLRVVAAISGVVVAAVAFFFGRGLFDRPDTEAEVQAIRSLAVLPLEPLSDDPNRENLADGMTYALISELGSVSALTVIGSRSVMRFKDSNDPVSEIAEALGVDALVTGSVTAAGQRVRIVAELINPTNERVIWSGAYERDLADIVALQGEVARAISAEVHAELTEDEERRLSRTEQVDPEAHEQYLLGMRFVYGDWGKALAHFERAIEIDPSHARAYAFKAQVLSWMAGDGQMPVAEARLLSREALDMALALDPEISEAHVVLGQFTQAESAFRRAVELNPNNPWAHIQLAFHLGGAGRLDEGFERINEALRLDPVSPFTIGWAAIAYHFTRQFHDSISLIRRVQHIEPDNRMAHIWLGLNYAALGMYDEAVAECDQVQFSQYCGTIYAVAGEREKAEAVYGRVIANPNAGPCYLAGIQMGLGNTDEAIAWVEKAWEERHPWRMICFDMPLWQDGLGDDPRYQAILQEIGASEASP
jgi:serine/threonine protein kinase/tetratricopeptide (TPR) repeat protein